LNQGVEENAKAGSEAAAQDPAPTNEEPGDLGANLKADGEGDQEGDN
jgi:hypothetical protein